MPVQKVPYAHRFGIVSTSYKEKIEREIKQRQQQESDRSSSAYSSDQGKLVLFKLSCKYLHLSFIVIRKHLILEVTEEFVRDYNRALSSEKLKLNELIYRMLQRLKVN